MFYYYYYYYYCYYYYYIYILLIARGTNAVILGVALREKNDETRKLPLPSISGRVEVYQCFILLITIRLSNVYLYYCVGLHSIRINTHVYVCVRVRACVRACVRAWVCLCAHGCARSCLCVPVCVTMYLRTYVRTCVCVYNNY